MLRSSLGTLLSPFFLELIKSNMQHYCFPIYILLLLRLVLIFLLDFYPLTRPTVFETSTPFQLQNVQSDREWCACIQLFDQMYGFRTVIERKKSA